MSKEGGFQPIAKLTQSANTSGATSSKEEIKTAPSLFDSMLSSVQSNQPTQEKSVTLEKTSSPSPAKTAAMPTVPLTENESQKSVVPTELSSIKSGEEKNFSVEAADQKAAPALQVQTQTKPESLMSVKESPTPVNSATWVQPIVEAKAIKPSVSLMDTLIQEAKMELNNSEKSLVETLKTPVLNSENKGVSPEVTQAAANADETLLVSKNNSTASLIAQTTQNTQTLPSENRVTSLLDELMKEVNVQIQKESETTVIATKGEVVGEVVETTLTQELKKVEGTVLQKQNVLVSTQEIVQEGTKTSEQALNAIKEALPSTPIKSDITSLVENKEDKASQELAKLTPTLNEKTTLTKEQITALPTQQVNNEQKSLLDRLLDETNATIKTAQNSTATKPAVPLISEELESETLLANIYKSAQNKASNEAFLERTQEGKTIVANATSVKDVKKGADLLNLGLQNYEVAVEEHRFKENVKNEFLNKLSVNRDIVQHDILKMSEEIVVQSKILKDQAVLSMGYEASTKKTQTLLEVEMSVSALNAYTIENRIIGARQQMGSMMSDLARNMYLNYKPPVTAFRMNLNPGNLGSIAVLIKNDKENGLSISLNMSHAATLESVVDNQISLRAALAKNFNAATAINLEFSMQDNAGSRNGNQQQKKQQQSHQASNDIVESLSQHNDSDKVSNYM